MIEDKEIWAFERSYLKRVINEINRQIDLGVNAADNYKKDAIELQKSMWEDLRLAPSSLTDLEDVAQMNQIQMELSNKASIYKFSCEKVGRLRRMLENPYFGRIDFLEKGERKAEPIYIGIHNLSDNDTMESLVYDWRAPVSGMFYDFEIGPSNYSCPAGLIEGEILLKRQYRIENSEIVYMFDSSLSINDAMLQEILGKSTDNRMRTIITSIQKEQNTVIRNSQDRILIVEGPAGSGKTSIALHRAAYLLYKYRETLTSENILIFSPNHVFEDYISHVLPELGEENIRRSTFADFFRISFFENQQVETVNQQMEYILTSSKTDVRLDCIKFKSSPLFLDVLKRYIKFLESGMDLCFKDFTVGNTLIVSAEDIEKLFKSQSERLPYANRLEKIRQRLFNILDEHEKKTALNLKISSVAANRELEAKYEPLKSDVLLMTAFDVRSLYINLFKRIGTFAQTDEKNEAAKYSRIAEYTIRELERGAVNYEDFAPLVYIKTVLEGVNSTASVKHIIIDEAQDYTAVQYEIFKTVFKNCSMTILGDTNQAVNGYMNIGSFDIISDTFDASSKRIALTKSYRSSKEIADFCKAILDTPAKTEQLNRHGSKPKIIKADRDAFYKRLAHDINDLKKKGFKLIAVICKTASQCRAVYQAISPEIEVGLISNKNEVYSGDVVIIPSYLAKGLEFDAVLVNSVDDKDYHSKEDIRLIYTVCTRALHELYMYYFGTMSNLISGIDNKLYIYEDTAAGKY